MLADNEKKNYPSATASSLHKIEVSRMQRPRLSPGPRPFAVIEVRANPSCPAHESALLWQIGQVENSCATKAGPHCSTSPKVIVGLLSTRVRPNSVKSFSTSSWQHLTMYRIVAIGLVALAAFDYVYQDSKYLHTVQSVASSMLHFFIG